MADVTIETSLAGALHADTDGVLRASLSELTGQLLTWACHLRQLSDGGARAEAFRGLALDLYELMPMAAGPGDVERAPETAGSAEPHPAEEASGSEASEGEDAAADRDTVARLAEIADAMAREFGGRIEPASASPAVPDPMGLWYRLHLICCFLDEAAAAKYRKQLYGVAEGEPDETYLVPALPELKIAGLTVADAEQHDGLAETAIGWDERQRDQFAPLLSLAGLTRTLVGKYTDLYISDTGHRIQALAERDRYQDRLISQLGNLADPGLSRQAVLDQLVRIDGTIRSVFPIPPPAASSWWSMRLRRSFELIEAHAAEVSPPATVVMLEAGTSTDSQEYRRYADQEDAALSTRQSSPHGKVLWPLRAYLSIPAAASDHAPHTRPARVVYSHKDGFRVMPARLEK